MNAESIELTISDVCGSLAPLQVVLGRVRQEEGTYASLS
jgi:hypothetical protein